MDLRIVVLGAGFGGLEVSTLLSDALGDRLDLTLIDKSDAFVFGFSKLDIMFRGASLESVRLPYRSIDKPGVTFRQEAITRINPETRRVTTDQGEYDCDVLVVALGADYEPGATPGLLEGGNEFYTVGGAVRLAEVLPSFTRGHAIVGVTSAPFKCPPAPYEAALMLHDYLTTRGVRQDCEISIITPLSTPIPPSPPTCDALLAAFAERDITFLPDCCVRELDPERRVARLDDGAEMAYDLFLGVPKHKVPDVVLESGLAENGWIPVDPQTLETQFPGVYAIGDVASVGIPKAGIFAEGAARCVAASVLAKAHGETDAVRHCGTGMCYIEFGGGRVGRVHVDFLSGPSVTSEFSEPSAALAAEKEHFGASRRARWFGL